MRLLGGVGVRFLQIEFAVFLAALAISTPAAASCQGASPQDHVTAERADANAVVLKLAAYHDEVYADPNGGSQNHRFNKVVTEAKLLFNASLQEAETSFKAHRQKVFAECSCRTGSRCRDDARFSSDYEIISQTIRVTSGSAENGYPRRDPPNPHVLALNYNRGQTVKMEAEAMLTQTAVANRIEEDRQALRAAVGLAALPSDITPLKPETP